MNATTTNPSQKRNCSKWYSLCLEDFHLTHTSTTNLIVFFFEETLIIALLYMTTGMTYDKMAWFYGGETFSKFLYHKYFHWVSGRPFEYWGELIPSFREDTPLIQLPFSLVRKFPLLLSSVVLKLGLFLAFPIGNLQHAQRLL